MTPDISRRSFLKHHGSAGLGLSAAGVLGSNDRSTYIVTERRGDDPVRSEKVSRQWNRERRSARKAVSALQERLLDDDRVAAVGIDYREKRTGGLKRPVITVDLTEEDDRPASVPETVAGVPVRTRPMGDPTPEMGSTWPVDGEVDCMQSGAALAAESDPTVGFTGTTAVEWQDYVLYLTCAHPFYDECSEDLFLEGVVHEESSDVIAKVVKFDLSQDWVLLYPVGDGIDGFGSELNLYSEGVFGRIEGHVTRAGLDKIASADEPIYKYGQTTGLTEGSINGENGAIGDYVDICEGQQWIEMEMQTDGGDSGAPYYRETDGDALRLIGVHWGTKGGGYYIPETPYASPAVALQENAGMTFGASSC